MTDVVSDIVGTAVGASWFTPYSYGVSRSSLENSQADARRRNIEDMFGVQAETFRQYEEKNFGYGILKSVGIGVLLAGATVGIGVLAFGAAALGGALILGIGIGFVGGVWNNWMHTRKARNSYNNYLDGIAAEGRAAQQQQRGPAIAPTMEYDNGTPGKSYVASLNAERANQQLVGSGYRGA